VGKRFASKCLDEVGEMPEVLLWIGPRPTSRRIALNANTTTATIDASSAAVAVLIICSAMVDLRGRTSGTSRSLARALDEQGDGGNDSASQPLIC
jgi:hypothetical protein